MAPKIEYWGIKRKFKATFKRAQNKVMKKSCHCLLIEKRKLSNKLVKGIKSKIKDKSLSGWIEGIYFWPKSKGRKSAKIKTKAKRKKLINKIKGIDFLKIFFNLSLLLTLKASWGKSEIKNKDGKVVKIKIIRAAIE